MVRFMAKVKRDRWGHWRWQGPLQKGRGQFSFGGKQSVGAHRAAWILFRGPIPDSADVHHVCRVPDCANPDHLTLLTPAEHNREHKLGVRKTHCKNGHPMEGDNVLWRRRASDGYMMRFCRECKNRLNAESYVRHRETRMAYQRNYYGDKTKGLLRGRDQHLT